MRKKLIIITSLVIVFSFGLYYILNDSYAAIKVLDSDSKRYIYEPKISMFPNLTLLGQPGTGGTGPFAYRPVIPTPAIVTVSASGYKDKRKIVFLVKGTESVIYMSRD